MQVEVAVRYGWTSHLEQPIDQNAPDTDVHKVAKEIICIDSSEEGSAPSVDEEGSSEEEEKQEHPLIDEAYRSAQDAFVVNKDGKLVGGSSILNLMETVPSNWPLSRLTLPLKEFVIRLDRLMAGYCMQRLATRVDPRRCLDRIAKSAKKHRSQSCFLTGH